MRSMMERLLVERTGSPLPVWKARAKKLRPRNEAQLRKWLAREGVTGYPQMLVVLEHFGYPDYLTASANDLIGAQFADRPQLRPIYDAIVKAVAGWEGATVQARKTYVSLVTPRRTFARIQPTTRTRVDLALRLDGARVGGRWQRATVHESMQVQVGLSRRTEFDAEVRTLLRAAFEQARPRS
jgi:uncharacterized protein DUF5655